MSAHDGTTIKLDQLLKLTGTADSGAQAKLLVQGGGVHVNGAVETRRGRKLHVGDVVTLGEHTVQVTAELLAGS